MKSKSDRLILQAVRDGYSATVNGTIYTPEGTPLKGGKSKAGHLNFIPRRKAGEKASSVLQHRFVYYYFHGDALFDDVLVRHLNDMPDDNRIENLRVGSYKENRADIPKEKLSSLAKERAPLLVERSRKLSDKDILELRQTREKFNTPYAELANMFGVSAMTAYRCVKKESWADVT